MKKIKIITKQNYTENINFLSLYITTINEINNIQFDCISFFKNEIIAFLNKNNFDPKKESIEYISFFYEKIHYHITIIGFDDTKKKDTYESIKNNLGTIISYAQKEKATSIMIDVENIPEESIPGNLIGKLFQSTILLKLYHFNSYISDKKKHTDNIIEINLYLSEKQNKNNYEEGIEEGFIIGNAINFARNLSDLPAKDLYPQSFIEKTQSELHHKNIPCEITIFDTTRLEELGMGGILGVGQGSIKKPYLLILKYTPNNISNKTVALVGKGVTFDTGGISIKPSEGMEDMKSDMSGAAAAVSAFIGLAQLQCPYTLYSVTPLAENMVDGNSIRPGDILTFYNGKTAEIKNTDAEGRLILADALAYTSDKIKPNIIIDLATLTGACRVALGPIYAGLMTEDNVLENQIKIAGKTTGDLCWSLPLEDAYTPNMHSDVADMCNIGTKGYRAGATMGGMFLREFVDPSIHWAHIDIASVATDCPHKRYIASFGATGFGVGLLIELLQTKKYIG